MLREARHLELDVVAKEDPLPTGCIRLFPFQDHEGWFDVQRADWMPPRSTEARQYQDGGDWYFEEPERGVVATFPDGMVRHLLPNPDDEHTIQMAS